LGAVAIHGAAVLVASRGAGISREMPVAVGLGLVSASLALGGAVAFSGSRR
jgi:hypothetical protein